MGHAATHAELHALFNDRDLDGLVKRANPDGYRFVDRARDITLDLDGFRSWLGMWVSSLDGRVTEATYLEDGDTTIARFVGRGTNVGPLGPFPATGKDAAFPLCEVLTWDADGRVTGGEIYYDQMTILVQLGHLEPPPA